MLFGFYLVMKAKENNYDCEHDWNGDTYWITKSGKMIYWYTHVQWAHLTTQAREPLIYAHYNKLKDPILESGVTCKKCKALIGDNLNFIF